MTLVSLGMGLKGCAREAEHECAYAMEKTIIDEIYLYFEGSPLKRSQSDFTEASLGVAKAHRGLWC